MYADLPTLTTAANWADLLDGAGQAALEAILPGYIHPRRWFGSKSRRLAAARIVEAIGLPDGAARAYLALVRLTYVEGDGETYVLPLAFATGAPAERLLRDLPHAAIARLDAGGTSGVLHDALFDRELCGALLDLIGGRGRLAGAGGELIGTTTRAFEQLRGAAGAELAPRVGTAEQSNTSIIYGDRLIMKLFRRLEPGLNPDLEIGRFLTERGEFGHIPPTAGAIEYRAAGGEPSALAFLQGFVPNQGDAWSYTLRTLAQSFERLPAGWPATPPDMEPASLLDLAGREIPPAARELAGAYLASAELLGRRTAELHLALSGDPGDPDFAPEPFGEQYRAALYQSMRGRAARSFQTLRAGLAALPDSLHADAERVLAAEPQVFERIRAAIEQPIDAVRTRIHGDYHLGQVLYTGDDFYIIDFEGEPARPLSERRVKSSPLQDVAGMLRSLHYAPYAVLLGQAPGVTFVPERVAALEPWARFWHRWVSAAFLKSYLATTGPAPFLPPARGELHALLDAYLLDKAIYELAYELNNRPTWVRIPLEGILQLVT
ncbi:MAG: putative maltokinase [Kouleothrix sp.]|nr:putative maltokinase [Kouleothrix sp.]